MQYDKDKLKRADNLGVFDDSFDAKVLGINDNEKNRMVQDFDKTKLKTQSSQGFTENFSRQRKKTLASLNVKLTLLEKIMLFFLSLFGIQSKEQFIQKKIVRNIEKELMRIRPPIYNSGTKRISKYFAFKLHDLYLKLTWLKQIFNTTINNKKLWDNPKCEKTIIEILFESLALINADEIDNKFSFQGIETIISQFENPRKAIETLEKTLYAHVYSIDKSVIEKVNKTYTNLIYFKNLIEFDYVALFKRFDPTFHPGVSPNFVDVSGEALVPYLRELEESILHIDLAMDNIFIFEKLFVVSKKIKSDEISTDDTNTTANDSIIEHDDITPDNLKKEVSSLLDVLRELMYRKYIVLLIQVIKSDPLYEPSFIHTKHDFFKMYLEILEKRIKITAKDVIKSRKKKKIASYTRKLFSQIVWVGIYNLQLSEELEQSGYLGFPYTFNLAIINSFFLRYYNTVIQQTINVLILNGIFTEKNFHKMVSDTFYNMDKFSKKFEIFKEDMKNEGSVGKRLLKLLARKDNFQNEHKNTVEKQIVSINGRARDLYEEFDRLFSAISDVIKKVNADITAKPPRYVRNIRGIGGFRSTKFLKDVEKSDKTLTTMRDVMMMLKE